MPGQQARDTRPPRPDTLDLYTVTETAATLGVSEKLVFSWVKDEILPAIRLGPRRRLIRIRRIDLEAFVEQDFEPSTPPGNGGSLRQDGRRSRGHRMSPEEAS
jgi:excisionase family DNA binding protein